MSNSPGEQLAACVESIIAAAGPHLVVGTPLGLGKPNALINALYQRVASDSALSLDLFTALSLELPGGGGFLQTRFLGPFVERHFGADYPALDYPDAVRSGRLPGNIQVSEFYFQSGRYLGRPLAQRHYSSSNYTHVARDMADRGCNVIVQMVGLDDSAPAARYSLGSNPDVTLDLLDICQRRGQRKPLLVGQVNRRMPFMDGDAVLEAEALDLVLDHPALEHTLFAPPRMPVNLVDHAIGLHASALIRDGGTLQIGIGSLGDAIVHACCLRQSDNPRYLELLEAVGQPQQSARLMEKVGDTRPFQLGLYGASEMFMDGFWHLYEAGILRRRVFDDLDLQQAINHGECEAPAEGGAVLHAAFFLGSAPFYDWLRGMAPEQRARFCMTRVSRINELYGGEALDRAQRQDARFVNTCMKMTLLGAAVSDGLAEGQVVSGVGGQYNFVAMAHALPQSRSILMLRATRQGSAGLESNIVFQYPHETIPRHLRDIVVTEYGVADLRGRTDEQCIQAMLSIADSRFQPALQQEAVKAGKLDPGWQLPASRRHNLPARLQSSLAGFQQRDLLPRWPFGSDFDELELQLLDALQHLRASSAGWSGRLGLIGGVLAARPAAKHWQPALERMGLARPQGLVARFWRRALVWALDTAERQKQGAGPS